MIVFLSSWAKGLGLTIVIVSILEMLLPNNKTKKYIRVIMGIYVIFTIISPLIENKEKFDVNNIDIEQYTTTQTSTKIDQTSMDERIKELYIEELEKDITKKVEEKGYTVSKCKVNASISDNEDETKISKIKLKIEKKISEENNIENKIVSEVQKIKPIDTSIKKDNRDGAKVSEKNDEKTDIKNSDIKNIKKFLIEEYGVNEKCLEIN